MRERKLKMQGSKIGSWDDVIYEVAWLILSFLTISLVSTKLIFAVGGSIKNYYLGVYVLFTILLYQVIKKDKERIACIVSQLLFLVCVVCAILFNYYVFDMSYDGSAYHEMAIGLLKNGWNPVWMQADDFVITSKLNVLGPNHALCVDHYCNASWILAAVIYSAIGFIQCGKAINLLVSTALFLMLYSCLRRWNYKVWFSFATSMIVAFNPVTTAQLFTNYVDGLLMNFLELGILACFIILKERQREKAGYCLLLISIVFCSNIKSTGLFYVGVFTIGFWAVKMIDFHKQKNRKAMFTLTSVLACMAMFSVLLIGFNPYVTNLVRNGNPLYPLMGDGKIDIMTQNQPQSFTKKSNFEKMVVSMYSEVDNIVASSGKEPKIKIPFTVGMEEISQCSVDARISGFGPWFGGIFTISIIVLVVYFTKSVRNTGASYFTIVLIISLLLACLFTGSWWARYGLYIYFIAVGALIILNGYFNEHKIVIPMLFATLLIVNTCFFAPNIIRQYNDSQNIRNRIEELAYDSKENMIEIYMTFEDFSGAQFIFDDYNINCEKFIFNAYKAESEGKTFDGIAWGYLYAKD